MCNARVHVFCFDLLCFYIHDTSFTANKKKCRTSSYVIILFLFLPPPFLLLRVSHSFNPVCYVTSHSIEEQNRFWLFFSLFFFKLIFGRFLFLSPFHLTPSSRRFWHKRRTIWEERERVRKRKKKKFFFCW